MKGREFEKLARNEFLPHLPGYVARGSLIYEEPVGDILKGIDADTSSFTADRLFVTAFAMPLYVPREHIVLSISRRLGGPAHFWTPSEPQFASGLRAAMVEEGLPFLEAHGTPAKLLEHTHWQDVRNIRAMELQAYTLLKVGRMAEATLGLSRAAAKGEEEGVASWAKEVSGRTRLVGSLLEANPDRALEQLEEWRQESLDRLKLSATSSEARSTR